MNNDVVWMVKLVLLMKAIVAHDPFYELRGGYFACLYCQALGDEEDHKDDCLWARARALVEEWDIEAEE